jgi:hypothetical protein
MNYEKMTIEEIEELLRHAKNCVNNYKNSISRKGKKQAIARLKELKKIYKEKIRNKKHINKSIMDIQLVLTYTLTTNNTNKIYYIKVNENDSKIKAKNLLAKTVFPELMKTMNITDSNIIESNKKDMIKAIKKSIYEESLNTLNNKDYTCIEVNGNITNKEKTIIKRRTQDGIMENIEGEKYNSKIYPNMNLYIVKHDYIKSWYYIIDINTGISLINVKTKNKNNIEEELNNMNMTENEVIKKLNNMINTTQTTKEIDITNSIEDKELHKDDITESNTTYYPQNNIIETDPYKAGMEQLRINTIEAYTKDIQEYKQYVTNIDYYNNLYKNKVNHFFTDNNIDQNKFFKQTEKYNIIQMLQKLNVSNIILNFKKYWITEQKLNDRMNGHYGGFKPTFSRDMINYIRIWLFDNSYKSNMLALEEQNELMTNYIHFNAGMKRIKAI